MWMLRWEWWCIRRSTKGSRLSWLLMPMSACLLKMSVAKAQNSEEISPEAGLSPSLWHQHRDPRPHSHLTAPSLVTTAAIAGILNTDLIWVPSEYILIKHCQQDCFSKKVQATFLPNFRHNPELRPLWRSIYKSDGVGAELWRADHRQNGDIKGN